MFEIRKFGAYISDLRKKSDMTQSELADKLGVTRQAVSKYECGDSFPDISVLSSLAKVFGVTPDELIESGNPTKAEAELLSDDSSGGNYEGKSAEDIKGIAPYLKPSVLERMADGLSKQGIDISSVVALAEYMNDESVMKLLENATFDTLDESLLEKLIPFLDEKSKGVIFEKILDGELDYHFLKIILPYAEYLISQIEAAVIYGGLDEGALKIVNDYIWNKK